MTVFIYIIHFQKSSKIRPNTCHTWYYCFKRFAKRKSIPYLSIKGMNHFFKEEGFFNIERESIMADN
jgi:hypothetical protein